MDLNNLKSDPIVVVGGGFGGLSTVQALLARSNGIPIILIDQSPRFLFKPLLYELLSDELQLWEVAPKYSDLASELGFIFLKDCVVEIEFDINQREYLVRRGIKPNIFDIEVNGTPLHKQADDRTNQKILEETILKVNYKSFTQIVILGSSTFVPFMQLSTVNRRDVIEDLLDIRIFSTMNNLIRDRLREKREQTKSLDLKKDNIKIL